MDGVLAPGTKTLYKSAWLKYAQFAETYGLTQTLPLNKDHLCCFITHLHEKNLSPSTITSIISGLSYPHKLHNLFDPTHAFPVRQLLTSLNKKFKCPDNRYPISESVLFKLLDNISFITLHRYNQLLLSAMFTYAFYFALRVGEITKSQHNIQLSQVKANEKEVYIDFLSYKHSSNKTEIHMIKSSNVPYCPVKILNEYLLWRGNQEGPLFILEGKAIARTYFSKQLTNLLKLSQINGRITSHSFRYGACNHWLNLGYTELQIMKKGVGIQQQF